MLNWKFPHRDILTEMRETAKVNYIQYGKGSKRGKSKSNGKGSTSGGIAVAAVAAVEIPPDPVERVRKFHYPQTFVGDVVKEGIKRGNLFSSGSSLQELLHKRTLW